MTTKFLTEHELDAADAAELAYQRATPNSVDDAAIEAASFLRELIDEVREWRRQANAIERCGSS